MCNVFVYRGASAPHGMVWYLCVYIYIYIKIYTYIHNDVFEIARNDNRNLGTLQMTYRYLAAVVSNRSDLPDPYVIF